MIGAFTIVVLSRTYGHKKHFDSIHAQLGLGVFIALCLQSLFSFLAWYGIPLVYDRHNLLKARLLPIHRWFGSYTWLLAMFIFLLGVWDQSDSAKLKSKIPLAVSVLGFSLIGTMLYYIYNPIETKPRDKNENDNGMLSEVDPLIS